jgi:hypothetical protein
VPPRKAAEDNEEDWEAPTQVDAMVLSGCRVCGNLTYEYIYLGGGTHRLCDRTKDR